MGRNDEDEENDEEEENDEKDRKKIRTREFIKMERHFTEDKVVGGQNSRRGRRTKEKEEDRTASFVL